MLKIREAIVVEGRYDKNTLSQVVDTVILETAGFGIFRDEETLALLRRIGAKRGLILLTDSDGAGFLIRNYLKGALPQDQVKHAYIPDRYGKERRKRRPGKEGKLGVEGRPTARAAPRTSGPPPGRRHRPGGGQCPPPSAPPHQGRPLRLRPVRRGGQPGKAAEAAAETGPARPPLPQRHAPHSLRPVRPECPAGGDAEPVIPAL